MKKFSRREAMIAFLSVGTASSVVGCKSLRILEELPIPVEQCVWVELKYAWACIDYDAVRQTLTQIDRDQGYVPLRVETEVPKDSKEPQ